MPSSTLADDGAAATAPLRELRALLGLAAPVTLSRAGLLAMTTVDTVMTGRAGAEELAFLAIGLAPFILLMLVGTGLLTGTVVVVAQAQGAGDAARAGRIWHQALLQAALVGVAAAALLAFAERFLLLAGQTPAIAAGGARVAFLLGLGMPAMLGYVATTLFLEGLGRPRPGVAVILLGNLLNLLLNQWLIWGGLGLPAAGAAGAALATSLARWCMLLLIVGYALWEPGLRAHGTRARFAPSRAIQGKLLRLGVPLAVSQGLETGAFQALTLLCGWLGPTSLAAYQIALNVVALVYMATVGLATATAVRVARGVGAAEPRAARAAAWLGLGAALALMLTLAPLLVLGAPAVVRVYTADPAVAALAAGLLGLVAAVVVLDGAQGVLTGGLRGAGDVWRPMLIHVASFWLVLLPAGWLLAFPAGLGARGLLGGVMAGVGVAAVLLLRRLRRLPWSRLARV